MPGFSVGSATVDIVPDARGFQAKLDAQLRKVQVKVEAVLDENGVQQKIQAAAKGATARIAVDADTGAAGAAIDAAARDRKASIKVDADGAAGTEAAIDAVARDRKANVKVDDNGSFAKLGATASAASGVISAMIATGAAIGPAIVPAAAAAAAAIGGIGTAAAASVGGIGVLVVGLKGVFGAVSEARKAQDAVALSAMKSAKTQVDSSSRIAAAQDALKNAEASLANVRANSASAARRASRAIVEAQRGVKTATEQAAKGVESAIARQAAAERTLQSALLQEERAQISLSAARRQAKRDMEDLTNAVAEGQLSQRQAALDVQTAYDALVAAQDSGSRIERDQAQLAYDRATQAQKRAADEQARLVADQKKSKSQGVEGAPVVTNAKQQLEDAKAAVAEAKRSAVEATKAIAEARVAGNRAVAKAEQDLADAVVARTDQQRQAAFAVAQAQQGVVSAQRSLRDANTQTAAGATAVATATDKATQAYNKLTPEGKRLADFLTDELIPGFERVRDIAQRPIALGMLKGLQAMKPLVKPVERLVKNLSDTMGDLLESAGKALGGKFWVDFTNFLADEGGQALRDVAAIFGNIAEGIAAVSIALEPVGDVFLGFLKDITKRFAEFVESGGLDKFLDYVEEISPLLGDFAKSFGAAFIDLLKAFAPIGEIVLDVLGKFFDIITKIPTKTLTKIVGGLLLLFTVVPAIIAVTAAFSGIAAAIAFVSTGIGGVVAAIVGIAVGIGIAAAAFKPFRDYLVNVLWPVLKQIGEVAMEGIRRGLGRVSAAIKRNAPALKEMGDGFRRFVTFITTKVLPLLGPFLAGGFEALGLVIGVFIDVLVLLYKQAKNVFVQVGKFFSALAKAIKDAWRDVLKPVWRAIVDFITVTIPNAFRDGKRKVMEWWNDLSSAIGRVWREGPKKNFEAMKDFVTKDLPRAFRTGVEAIGRAWDKVKGVAKVPIKFIVDTVIDNGLLAAFRKVSDLVGYDAGKNFHVELPKGFARGGWTGPGPKYKPAGIVHADEFVINKDSRRRIEAEAPGYLDRLNGYANGGLVASPDRGGALRRYRPVRGYGLSQGLHDAYTGFPAIDFSMPVGQPVAAAATGRVTRSYDIRGFEPRNGIHQNGFKSYGRVIEILSRGFSTLYAHLSKRSVKQGDNVAGGQIIGLSGNTGRSSGPHLHFGARGISPTAFVNGSTDYTGDAGSKGVLAELGDTFTKIVDYGKRLRDKFAGPLARIGQLGKSPLVQAAAGIPRLIADKLVEKGRSFVGDTLGNSADTFIGTLKGLLGKGTAHVTGHTSPASRRLAAIVGPKFGFRTIGTYPGHQPTETKALDFMIQNAAQGNAAADYMKAQARQLGINYLIWNRRIWNIQRDSEGWRRYFDGGSSDPSRAHTNHVHASLFDNGGWLQPGTTMVHNATGKPEPILNPEQWKAFQSIAARGGGSSGPAVHIDRIETADARGVAAEIESRWMLREALYPSWA